MENITEKFSRINELKAELIYNAQIIDSMVKDVIGDSLNELDNYMGNIRKVLLSDTPMTDMQLDACIMKIPMYLYHLIEISQMLETRKGLASESAKMAESDIFCKMTEGAVAKKEKDAFVLSRHERITAIVFKSASELVKAKIDSALEVLASLKKVQAKRVQDRTLTGMVGNSVF